MTMYMPRHQRALIRLVSTLLTILMLASVAGAVFITDGTSNTFTDGSVRFRGFDPVLEIGNNGQKVFVTGKVNCTAGERVQILARLTQRTTGGYAEGSWKGICTGHLQVWNTEAVARGESKFEPGVAEAVAFGQSSENGRITDVLQWLDDVTVVNQ